MVTSSAENVNKNLGLEASYGRTESSRLSPKSTEQIRRIHELVALYRCKFKQSASDAAVMGTLHSAASVIQIHFRYLKHLKEAGLLQQAPGDKPAEDPTLV